MSVSLLASSMLHIFLSVDTHLAPYGRLYKAGSTDRQSAGIRDLQALHDTAFFAAFTLDCKDRAA